MLNQSTVYLVIIVRECGIDVWGVYADRKLAEANVEQLYIEKRKENAHMRFDFCHVVERQFYS